MNDGDKARPRRRWYWSLARIVVVSGILLTVLWISGCMERFFYMPTREETPTPTWLHPKAEAVWFESEDGTRLRGWFVPAVGRPSREAMTVLHVHGNAGSMMSHYAFVERLPAAGFNVFLFDYRGYGESEGSARSRGPLIEDTRAALRTLRARPDIDPERVAVVAQSLGGAIAVIAVADDLRNGGAIAGVVLESPFASWRDVAATALGGDPPSWWARSLATALIPDGSDATPRPVDAIATIDRPILVVHGDADRVVSVSHGKRLAAAAPRAELMIVPGGEHNTLQWDAPEARRRIIEFLRGLDEGQ